jgi:hypothetical protein
MDKVFQPIGDKVLGKETCRSILSGNGWILLGKYIRKYLLCCDLKYNG